MQFSTFFVDRSVYLHEFRLNPQAAVTAASGTGAAKAAAAMATTATKKVENCIVTDEVLIGRFR
jgi:hypothetical protein